MKKYRVLTKYTDENDKTVEVVETTRTARKAAEDDVRQLADVAHKKAWIVEVDV